jgi:hypothetical protein
MRVPQVSDRIKEVPAQALRGVFAGIGQLLLLTDKLRNKTPAGRYGPHARVPEPPATAAGTGDQAAGREQARPPVPAETQPAPKAQWAQEAQRTPNTQQVPEVQRARQTQPVPEDQRVRQTRRAPEDQRLAGDQRAPAAADVPGPARTAERAGKSTAPLPNYDELSVASLRARLRNLDVTQVRRLVEYEKAHAGRADVVAMFERRIAKLEAGD